MVGAGAETDLPLKSNIEESNDNPSLSALLASADD